jgi:hypothetical protein
MQWIPSTVLGNYRAVGETEGSALAGIDLLSKAGIAGTSSEGIVASGDGTQTSVLWASPALVPHVQSLCRHTRVAT